MAKIIKEIVVCIEADESNEYSTACVSYVCGSSDDSSLKSAKRKMIELEGADLVKAMYIFDLAKDIAEDEEGI